MRAVHSTVWAQFTLALTLLTLGVVIPHSAWAQGALENPAHNSFQSGQGIISGWYCQANIIEIVVNGTIRVQAPYGSLRGDTQAACGDVNNGFGFQVNWNELGDGTHTVVVLADGNQFGQATFTVVTMGISFLQGASGYAISPQFPLPEYDTVLWRQESLQNFVIVGFQPHTPNTPGGGSQKCTEHSILATANSGQFIQLEDNSVWEVDLSDRYDVQLWISSHDVLLCDLKSDYGEERTMINLDRRDDSIVKVIGVAY
jgi:hypothetical protein